MLKPPKKINASEECMEFLSHKLSMLCDTAPEFSSSVQENHRKLTVALLERAKDICARQGVSS